MPDHDADRMEVVFPFIYQPRLAPGVLIYLADYLGQFTERSFGDMIVTPQGHRCFDEDGRPAYALDYEVALPPFDLGVTQQVTFSTTHSEQVGAYQMTLSTTRLSGQDANWVATNKPFLERLRKFLLRWRNMSPPDHDLFTRRGNEFFSGVES